MSKRKWSSCGPGSSHPPITLWPESRGTAGESLASWRPTGEKTNTENTLFFFSVIYDLQGNVTNLFLALHSKWKLILAPQIACILRFRVIVGFTTSCFFNLFMFFCFFWKSKACRLVTIDLKWTRLAGRVTARSRTELTWFTVGFSLIQIFALTNEPTNGEETTASLTGVKFILLNSQNNRLNGIRDKWRTYRHRLYPP